MKLAQDSCWGHLPGNGGILKKKVKGGLLRWQRAARAGPLGPARQPVQRNTEALSFAVERGDTYVFGNPVELRHPIANLLSKCDQGGPGSARMGPSSSIDRRSARTSSDAIIRTQWSPWVPRDASTGHLFDVMGAAPVRRDGPQAPAEPDGEGDIFSPG